LTKKVIITCAVTGATFTPTMSPYLPYKPDDIIDNAIEAYHTGAAVLHLHARDPETGAPATDPALFKEYVTRIKEETGNAIICLTTGGATGQSIEERFNVIKVLQPELCSCNLGTINYGGFPMFPNMTFERWQELDKPRDMDRLITNTKRLLESLTPPDANAEILAKGENYIQTML